MVAGVMLLCAGCVSSGVPGQTQSPTMTATESPTVTPVGTDSPMDTPTHSTNGTVCPEFISFGGITAGMDGWDPGIVRISYTIPSSTEVLFVVYKNETVVGTDRKSYSQDFAMDGWPVQLDEPLEGPHTVRVLAYTDMNGDGSIDPATDQPCQRNGSVIQAEPTTFAFSTSQNESTTLATTESPT